MGTSGESEVPALVELEARVLEQDHRLFPVLWNWWTRKKRFPDGDPRRDACWKALLWKLIIGSTATAAVSGVGLAGWIGLLITWNSNELLRQQNKIIADNAAADLRTRLLDTLYRHSESQSSPQHPREFELPSADLKIAAHSHRARAEALNEFVKLERRRSVGTAKPRINVSYALLDHVDATGLDLRGIELFAASMIACHLIDADLSGAKMSRVQLSGALLDRTKLISADLRGADLRSSVILNCNLTNADLSDAILVGIVVDKCNLVDAKPTNALLFHSGMSQHEIAAATIDAIKSHGWKVVEKQLEDGTTIKLVE